MLSSLHKGSDFFSVIMALLWNFFITILKTIGFFLSGSGSLFSEAIHSFADTLNQSLLMVGIRLSRRKPNDDFSYGYGRERFFWALISACGIFFVGAGVTLYHGISALYNPHEIHPNNFSFIILAISFVIESITFGIALQKILADSKEDSWLDSIKHADPIVLAVLYEDGVAVIGVIIAFCGLSLSLITKNPLWDALASIIIGALLGVVAVVLIQKNRRLLVGQTISEEMREDIIELLEQEPLIEKVVDFKSTILGEDNYRIKCEVEMNGEDLIREISRQHFLRNSYEEVREDYQEFLCFCVDFAGRVPRILGSRIDGIEKKIRTKFPEVRHIDIEIN